MITFLTAALGLSLAVNIYLWIERIKFHEWLLNLRTDVQMLEEQAQEQEERLKYMLQMLEESDEEVEK